MPPKLLSTTDTMAVTMENQNIRPCHNLDRGNLQSHPNRETPTTHQPPNAEYFLIPRFHMNRASAYAAMTQANCINRLQPMSEPVILPM